MDSKQNLTPELKEIYDRVMNTPAGQSSLGGPAGAKGVIAPPATPIPPPTTQNPSNAAVLAGAPPPTTSTIPAAPAPTIPEATPSVDSSEYLSSAQPRPLQDIGTKPFSFSGKVVTATTADKPKPSANTSDPAATQPAAVPSAAKKGLSTPIVVVLFIAFALVWTFFWLVLLGFIKF